MRMFPSAVDHWDPQWFYLFSSRVDEEMSLFWNVYTGGVILTVSSIPVQIGAEPDLFSQPGTHITFEIPCKYQIQNLVATGVFHRTALSPIVNKLNNKTACIFPPSLPPSRRCTLLFQTILLQHYSLENPQIFWKWQALSCMIIPWS